MPGNAVRDDDVVARTEAQMAELRVQGAVPLVGKPDLVGLAVPVKIAHALGGVAGAQNHVLVSKQGAARRHGIAPGGEIGCGESAVFERAKLDVFDFGRAEIFHFEHTRWKEMVVEDGLDAGKTLQTHHFFTVEIAIRFAKLDVAFGGNLSEFVVKGHRETS